MLRKVSYSFVLCNREGRIFLANYGIEIKIFGMKSINRALNGDRVAVEILPEKGIVRYYQLLEST